MIHLYTWSTPNGRKISIALEEMAIPYQVHPVNLSEGQQHDPEFLKISPHNAIPAIFDDETGFSLVESAAIAIYLAEKSKKLLPTEEKARWETIQWLMWQAAAQGPMLGQAHHFLKFNPGKSPYAEERFHTQAKRIYKELNNRLGGRGFIAGTDISIADTAIWPWISRYEFHQIDMTEYSNIHRWYLQLAERPAFQAGYKIPDASQDIPIPKL